MAAGKEIRSKIASVGSTRKITRAMEMVAASKMRRSQERMAASKPYAQRIREVIGHLANAMAEYKHDFLTEREVRRQAIIVVSSDRGLCGGLNINLFKHVISDLKARDSEGVQSDLCLIGGKGIGFFKSVGGNVVSSARDLGEQPAIADLIGSVKVVLDAFSERRVDRVMLGSNELVNTMVQTPRLAQLLPLPAEEDAQLQRRWDYIYEPDDAKALLDRLVTRYVESQVYQSVVENGACEQAARMLAMRNATENADKMTEELQLAYNKARQAAITQELAEIVSGSEAL